MTATAVPRWRRIAGAVLMPIGVGLLIASACPILLAVADYFVIEAAWGMTCASEWALKGYLIAGVMVIVLGHRLFSGRSLRTGAKPGSEHHDA